MRHVDLMTADHRSLAILLAQAPVVGLIIAAVIEIGDSVAAKAVSQSQVCFVLAISAIWFGCLNSVREIVKERPIYRRERSINLEIAPYLLSKIVPLAALTFVQCGLFLAVVQGLVAIPGSGAERFAILFLSALAAAAMGLAVSSLVTTADKAVAIVPLLLIPQVILSDGVVRLKGASLATARLAIIAFWAYDSLKSTLTPDVRDAVDLAGRRVVSIHHSFGAGLLAIGGFFVIFMVGAAAALRNQDRIS